MTEDELRSRFGPRIAEAIKKTAPDMSALCEVRLRAGKPLTFRYPDIDITCTCPVRAEDISEALGIMSRHSLYACSEELRNGYLTLEGGHRAGICGQAVVEGGKIKTLKNISSLNLRITREIKGCAEALAPKVALPRLKNVMIVSPPGLGKTTLLRDLIRLLSDGVKDFPGVNIGVADERSELAGCHLGIPQNDLGARTDVLDAAPKAEAMMLLLRSMSPRIIAVDEIGRREDAEAIEEIINAGVNILCTAHGNGLDDLRARPHISELIKRGVFGLYIILGGKAGEVREIIEEDGNVN